MIIAVTFIASFLVCAAAVYVFRRLASGSTRLLDIPNERSSHSKPVVRGAGLAIVLTVLGGYLVSAGSHASIAYVAAAGSIAVISFFDDLRSIPLLPRLIVHFAAAVAVVYWCGGYTGLAVPLTGESIDFGLPGVLITILFIVWMTNAFNFMDGIDGIAGIQGVGAGLGWVLVGIGGGQPVMAAFGALIVGSCLAFLLFNWQPASVFMGDVGSTFLGFTLASVPLVTAETSAIVRSEGFLFAAAFLWLFLFDTVYTRLRQILRLRPFWRAHREHIYQQIVVAGASHASVSVFFGIVAILIAIAAGLSVWIGQIPLAILLLAGPVALLLLARKKRLT